MGTPFKNLLFSSPKIFSPISPSTNFVINSTKKSNIAKQLFNNDAGAIKKKVQSNVKIHVTDYDLTKLKVPTPTDILFNTPNKNELLTNGVKEKQEFNILGKGAFGTVIRGINKGSIVAIKIVKNKNNNHINEKNALHLHHENIVKTIDITFSSTLNYFLVLMEYFPKCISLQQLLDSEDDITESQKLKFALDVTKGLQYCHENNVLHLDVKPKNMLIHDNCCKLCDFGNSVLKDDLRNFNHQGTIAYTDPEILLGKLPSTKSDIYSLGIVLWQIKYRKLPYENTDNNETIIYKVVKIGMRPKGYEENCEYWKLFCQCWDCDPEQRPQIGDILNELNSLLVTHK
ncbi:unnamed protein product [Brassicogethes aeneus]|uniref:non-specific serine/threonine protein kinase n=1 Tax=Brassicogethes aeneus TaxID=1431903 RepID=A0A9P0B9J3_BRAAE|nr:unnamed protein product [Brassicogethes aeneus]